MMTSGPTAASVVKHILWRVCTCHVCYLAVMRFARSASLQSLMGMKSNAHSVEISLLLDLHLAMGRLYLQPDFQPPVD